MRLNILCMCFAVLIVSASCTDWDDEKNCEHNYGSCHTTPYTQGSFTVTYTINAENPSISIELYKGTYDGTPDYTRTVSSGSSSLFTPLPIDDYTARIVYIYKGNTIEAYDSDSIESNSETYCEGTCYELDNGEADCTLDTSAFDDYKSGDDRKCFIATAAYGSSFAPKVKVLRDFRDSYLLSHSLGRNFVKWYYRVSPPVSHVIQRDDYLRMITRSILTPVVFVIEYPAILLLFPLLAFIFVMRRSYLSS